MDILDRDILAPSLANVDELLCCDRIGTNQFLIPQYVKDKISLNSSHISKVVNKCNLSEIQQDFRIVKTRLAVKDKHSIVVTIPKPILERYGLNEPTHVILLPREDGILIRRLEVREK